MKIIVVEDEIRIREGIRDLIGMLEEEEHVPVRPSPIHLQGQGCQGGGVAVVAAFVPHAGALGAVGGVNVVLNGQGVKVGPEGHSGPACPRPVQGVEPAPPVHNVQAAGVGPEEVHQLPPGPLLLAGQLRVLVQGVAQGGDPRQIGLVHPQRPL